MSIHSLFIVLFATLSWANKSILSCHFTENCLDSRHKQDNEEPFPPNLYFHGNHWQQIFILYQRIAVWQTWKQISFLSFCREKWVESVLPNLCYKCNPKFCVFILSSWASLPNWEVHRQEVVAQVDFTN